jgi:hypothetical protein
MSYEQKDNTGVLFRNEKREKETQPTHAGQAMVNGEMVKIAAWVNEKNGKKYFSLKFSEASDAQEPKKKIEEIDSDIPW